MKATTLKYIISLVFTSLLLIKVGVSIVSMSSSRLNEQITELLMETEEKKNNSRPETPAEEELFGKALLPEDLIFIGNITSDKIVGITVPLQDVYLDTLTPPPNNFSC